MGASLFLKIFIVIAFCEEYICQQQPITEIEVEFVTTLVFPRNGGNYLPCITKKWLIKGPKKNSYIEVTIEELDLRDKDNLCFGIGKKFNENEKASFTGGIQLEDVEEIQKQQVLKSKNVWVRFFSDENMEGRGFKLKFRVMEPCFRGGIICIKGQGKCYGYADSKMDFRCICKDGFKGDLCGQIAKKIEVEDCPEDQNAFNFGEPPDCVVDGNIVEKATCEPRLVSTIADQTTCQPDVMTGITEQVTSITCICTSEDEISKCSFGVNNTTSTLSITPCPPLVFGRIGQLHEWFSPECVVNDVVVGSSTCTPSSGSFATGIVQVECTCNLRGQVKSCSFEVNTEDGSVDPCLDNPCQLGHECVANVQSINGHVCKSRQVSQCVMETEMFP